IVQNKCELGRPARGIPVSARTGEGMDSLRAAMVAALDVDLSRDRPDITNIRHIALLQRTQAALKRAHDAASADGGSMSEEFVLSDLQDARATLEEVT